MHPDRANPRGEVILKSDPPEGTVDVFPFRLAAVAVALSLASSLAMTAAGLIVPVSQSRYVYATASGYDEEGNSEGAYTYISAPNFDPFDAYAGATVSYVFEEARQVSSILADSIEVSVDLLAFVYGPYESAYAESLFDLSFRVGRVTGFRLFGSGSDAVDLSVAGGGSLFRPAALASIPC